MLDLSEFRLALRKFARVPASMFSNRDIADLFAAVDTSRNGRVNATEFAAFMRLGTDLVRGDARASLRHILGLRNRRWRSCGFTAVVCTHSFVKDIAAVVERLLALYMCGQVESTPPATGSAGSDQPHDASGPDWNASTRERHGSAQQNTATRTQEAGLFGKLAQRAVFAGPINDATSLYVRESRAQECRPQNLARRLVATTPATPADFIVEAAVGPRPPGSLHSAAGHDDTKQHHSTANFLASKETKEEQTQALAQEAGVASESPDASDKRSRAKEHPHMPLPDDAAAAEVRASSRVFVAAAIVHVCARMNDDLPCSHFVE